MTIRYLAFAVLLLTMLSSISFAECTGYNDSFSVRVLDGKLRPVDGAQVWVKYDGGTSFGEQYHTTKIAKTGTDGTVPIQIWNAGTTIRKIDCNIYINATSWTVSKVITIEANIHGAIVDVILDNIYPVKFYVTDQAKKPLANASVTLLGKTEKTGQDGLLKYYIKQGEYEYFVNYEDGSQYGKLKVTGDTSYELIIEYRKISMDVGDDNGQPIKATIEIGGKTYETDDGGHFEREKVFGDQIPYIITYNGILKKGQIFPVSKPNIQIFFDTHAPKFDSVKVEAEDTKTQSQQKPKVQITVSDPGTYASGIDGGSIKFYYRVASSNGSVGAWETGTTFTTGFMEYTAEFPELPENAIVEFRAEIKDKEGNIAQIDGKFTTLKSQTKQNEHNNTENQIKPQNNGENTQGIPFLYIAIGVIIAILAVYLIFKLKTRD